MLILGIDTATEQVGCAIGGHEGILAACRSARGRRHAESLAPAIRTVSEQSGVELAELGAIAVDVGPGLFTGLRVGLATGVTMAQALGVPMLGISSLDLLAWSVRFSGRPVAAVVDARRGEVFYALYRPVPGGVQRELGPAVGAPGDLVAELTARGEEVLLVGDGPLRHADAFAHLERAHLAGASHAHPSPTALVTLAHERALREEFVAPFEIEPVYLREPDAVANWASRIGTMSMSSTRSPFTT
ncbi:MAG: tRNA (adenosine(37)-N6)-threonylcarbamoyltransferase complex dimerization subunit type 1 TsaB [Actinomycetota bacterium]